MQQERQIRWSRSRDVYQGDQRHQGPVQDHVVPGANRRDTAAHHLKAHRHHWCGRWQKNRGPKGGHWFCLENHCGNLRSEVQWLFQSGSAEARRSYSSWSCRASMCSVRSRSNICRLGDPQQDRISITSSTTSIMGGKAEGSQAEWHAARDKHSNPCSSWTRWSTNLCQGHYERSRRRKRRGIW